MRRPFNDPSQLQHPASGAPFPVRGPGYLGILVGEEIAIATAVANYRHVRSHRV